MFFRRSRRRRVAAPFRKRPSLTPTMTGAIYLFMTCFMGLAAANTQANLLFGVFGLMIGVFLVAWVISRAVLRRVGVTRALPEHAVVGQRVPIQYEFANRKHFWPSLSITLAELDVSETFTRQPLAYMLHAAPRMTASISTDVIPRRRGLHVFDRYQLSTSFPFGFIQRAADGRQHETLLIFPAIGRVDSKLVSMCQSADRSGATMRPRRGGDDEFYGVKEYRRGETPRNIYWRRSARTGILVSKEMTQVSPPRLLLLVDTHLLDRSLEEHVNVERTIAMAASLASHALESGLMVGLYVWSGSDWLGMHPSRGKRHRRDVLSQLGQLGLNTQKQTQALLDASREFFQGGATPILLTPRDIQVGMTEHARFNLVVVSAVSPQAASWFTFDPSIDFERCMPYDQEPDFANAPTIIRKPEASQVRV